MRNVGHDLRHVFVRQHVIRRTARGGHKVLVAVQHLFGQLGRFIGCCHIGPFGHFDHVVEPQFPNGADDVGERGLELSRHGRGDERHGRFLRLKRFEEFDQVGLFDHGSERTGGEAASAIDTFRRVDMFFAVFVFADGSHGARLLARHGNVDDGVERAVFHALAAIDASGRIDMRLSVGEMDGSFVAVDFAGPGHAAPAHVGDDVVDFHACRAGVGHHGQRIFGDLFPVERAPDVFGERGHLVFLFFDTEAEYPHGAVFQDGAVFVNAATGDLFVPFRPHFVGDAVDLFFQSAGVEQFDDAREEFAPQDHGVVGDGHSERVVRRSVVDRIFVCRQR